MPSPFPGMDPWLENPARWPDVHGMLVTTLREALGRAVRPRYVVTMDVVERSGGLRHRSLSIEELDTRAVVTSVRIGRTSWPGDGSSFVQLVLTRDAASSYQVVVGGPTGVAARPIALRERLPVVAVPLRGDESVLLDLQSVLDTAYDRAGYDLILDYEAELAPPLAADDRAWARERVHTWRATRST